MICLTRVRMRRIVLIMLCAGLLAIKLEAQKDKPQGRVVSEQEARAIAKDVVSVIEAGDQKAFEKGFRDRMKKIVRNYDGSGETLRSFGPVVRIYSRLEAFQDAVSQQIRIFKPLEEAQWSTDAVVVVLSSVNMTDEVIDRMVLNRN